MLIAAFFYFAGKPLSDVYVPTSAWPKVVGLRLLIAVRPWQLGLQRPVQTVLGWSIRYYNRPDMQALTVDIDH